MCENMSSIHYFIQQEKCKFKQKMKKIISCSTFLIFLLIIVSFKNDNKISGEKILKKMYSRYNNSWYKNFTFDQTTENYLKDSLVKTATWHETIVFPDHFRITFGDVNNGNAVIFVKDSSFNFAKGKLTRKGLRGEDLTFLLGGMYFISFDSVKTKMVKEGYDITKSYETQWQGNAAFVIGADNDTEKLNQIWIDKEKLIVVRFIHFKGENKEEAVFGDHVKFGKAWSETSCIFYSNDKVLQKEKYFNCKVNGVIDMDIFDPYNFKAK